MFALWRPQSCLRKHRDPISDNSLIHFQRFIHSSFIDFVRFVSTIIKQEHIVCAACAHRINKVRDLILFNGLP